MRAPRADDLPALADLKIAWSAPERTVSLSERTHFIASLARWMADREDRLVCRVAEVDGTLVGMAWLVLDERVPNVDDAHRMTGDVQSVFVLAEHRGHGIGTMLVRSLCEAADAVGARLSVRANDASVPLYRSAGFVAAGALLERRPGAAP
ncbi:L-amino acid N-acyltransferase YncA [Ruania alba]|uniref:L-amino acid N-acyltransferase YncA n=1 Tax=Ruania alba TaxID=648782 RepID=A0A1H5BW91_9MICO|nr:L-amino acid N-acyltransferase YncA [Ruania alba]